MLSGENMPLRTRVGLSPRRRIFSRSTWRLFEVPVVELGITPDLLFAVEMKRAQEEEELRHLVGRLLAELRGEVTVLDRGALHQGVVEGGPGLVQRFAGSNVAHRLGVVRERVGSDLRWPWSVFRNQRRSSSLHACAARKIYRRVEGRQPNGRAAGRRWGVQPFALVRSGLRHAEFRSCGSPKRRWTQFVSS